MDLGDQADEAWLLSVQRKLYQWSRKHPEDSYRDLWNWTTDIRNLRCAWRKIALNKGRRTAGVDGMTVAGIRVAMGMELFLEQLHGDLKSGRYKPSPSRRKLIPKPRQPGKFRPLGIPTVRDRVVQRAVKNILEPIFEAGFWHVSYGFRPGRGCHGALEHIRMCMRLRATADGSGSPLPLASGGRGGGAHFDVSNRSRLSPRSLIRAASLVATKNQLAIRDLVL
jgi:retron-type reverse transcriptase